jgi:eukaryotic-like serine/threonine-protein kinase
MPTRSGFPVPLTVLRSPVKLGIPQTRRAMADSLESVREALAGRYTVLRTCGHGSMASVFVAEPRGGGPLVALKALHRQIAAALGPERFQREIAILGRLRHAHIVPMLDSGTVDLFFYLVMPYVNAPNLRARVQQEGRLSLGSALSIARDVAEAIDYAHTQNVLHRDIKPENILIDGDRAMVCDFGLARAIDRAAVEPLSSSGLVIGTPAYMSPEQAAAEENLGPGCDIYALGCVLYEMLTGELPFTGSTSQAMIARHVSDPPPSLRAIRPELSEKIERAIFRALAKRPKERPRSARELVRALAGA